MPEKLTLTKSTLYLPDTAKEELEKKKNMGIEGHQYLMPTCGPPDKVFTPHPAVVQYRT